MLLTHRYWSSICGLENSRLRRDGGDDVISAGDLDALRGGGDGRELAVGLARGHHRAVRVGLEKFED